MRTATSIAIVTAMAVAAMWAADVITRPPQRPIQSSLEPASSAETNAMRNANSISEHPYHGLLKQLCRRWSTSTGLEAAAAGPVRRDPARTPDAR